MSGIRDLSVQPLMFISYSRADTLHVERLLASLKRSGISADKILCDASGLETSVPYRVRLKRWISDCEIFVAVYSINFFLSKNCWRELISALHSSQADRIKCFVPIILDKRLIFLTPLSSFQFYFGHDFAEPLFRDFTPNLTADYLREFKSLSGFFKYRLLWPLLHRCSILVPKIILITVLLTLAWCSWLFLDGRVPFRDELDRFTWGNAKAADKLPNLVNYQFDRSPVCATTKPILWPQNICAQLTSISRNDSHIVLRLRIWSPLLIFPSTPLCSFPNTTFASWIRLEFVGPNGDSKIYRIAEAFVPKEDGAEARIDTNLDLQLLMHQFTEHKKKPPILKDTRTQEAELLGDFSWLTRGAQNQNDGAQKVRLYISPAWCMPFFYDGFYRIVTNFVDPPAFSK